MPLTEAEKRAQKKYNENTITLSCSYKPGSDLEEGKIIKKYLSDTGIKANSYIKELIRIDLINKGVL